MGRTRTIIASPNATLSHHTIHSIKKFTNFNALNVILSSKWEKEALRDLCIMSKYGTFVAIFLFLDESVWLETLSLANFKLVSEFHMKLDNAVAVTVTRSTTCRGLHDKVLICVHHKCIRSSFSRRGGWCHVQALVHKCILYKWHMRLPSSSQNCTLTALNLEQDSLKARSYVWKDGKICIKSWYDAILKGWPFPYCSFWNWYCHRPFWWILFPLQCEIWPSDSSVTWYAYLYGICFLCYTDLSKVLQSRKKSNVGNFICQTWVHLLLV